MDYDHNIHWSNQTVRLTFGLWQYRVSKVVNVKGNCWGFDVIEAALDKVLDALPCREGVSTLVMHRVAEDGENENLICDDDDEDNGVDWLKSMLISAEIVAIEKEPYR